MPLHIQIPKELSHLKVDERGYPIPYFVSAKDEKGRPEFRFIQPERIEQIIEKKLCHVCGKKLPKDFHYFIAGPQGLKNRVSTDAAMHRVCAEFSLMACPHLFLQKADRRDNDKMHKKIAWNNPANIPDKPNALYLVKSDKFTLFYEDKRGYLRFRPVSTEEYVYENGKLTKAE